MQNLFVQTYLWNTVLGVIVSGVGLSVLAFSLFRWKRKDISLMTFGATSLLYGSRFLVQIQLNQYVATEPTQALFYINAIVAYVIAVPLSGFLLHLFGRGWRNSMLWVFRAATLFAFIGILSDVIQAIPFSLERINNVLVIVWAVIIFKNATWPGMKRTRELQIVLAGFIVFGLFAVNENLVELNLMPWDWSEEAIGFLAFLLALGYVAGHRFFSNEARLLTIEREMEIARQIQSSILPRTLPTIHGLNLAVRYVPMASVGGDFYDVLLQDERHLCFLVADVSGHGVGAALIASMLKVAFASQQHNLSRPEKILAGLNHTLKDKLGDNFVTAACLFLDTDAGTMQYASAGHPPLILYRKPENKVYEFGDSGIILGPLPEAEYRGSMMQLESGDRLILYTDGIIETRNASGCFFGDGPFKNFIETHAHMPAEVFADTLLDHLTKWSGKPSHESLDDDLTLIVVDIS